MSKNWHFLFFSVFTIYLGTAQKQTAVDFKKIEATIVFNEIKIDSILFDSYQAKFAITKAVDSIFLDAIDMHFQNITLNGKKVKYKNNGKKLVVYHKFKASSANILRFNFFAAPKKAMYFVGWNNDAPNQIWTQGQGKNTSNWLPSLDDTNDKIEFDLTFYAPNKYTVISNGTVTYKIKNERNTLWKFNMNKPMSSYLTAVVVGDYNKVDSKSKSGIPIELYYYPEDSLKVEPTYRYTNQIFDFLEEELQVDYPWQNYKQVPVHDFLYGGMENTTCTIFNYIYVVDAIGFNDQNYVNVNAHELAHQWFGDFITAQSGADHWIQEGFATYYAVLAEKQIFGDDYYFWRLYEYAQEITEEVARNQSKALTNPKASSTIFYKKGAFFLHVLREVIGEKAFQTAITNFLNKHAFSTVTTQNFIAEINTVTTKNNTDFFNYWLYSEGFSISEILEKYPATKMANFIKHTAEINCENKDCASILQNPKISEITKAKIIEKNTEYISKEVLENGSLKVRQAIAKQLETIPENWKNSYETLLTDKSYKTIEYALINLCLNFPEDRIRYLEKTKNYVGLSNKNVRILWLALALSTPNYQNTLKPMYINELVAYTSAAYEAPIRVQAFNYLQSLEYLSDELIENYKQASTHFNWRLKKFARDFLEQNNLNTKIGQH